MVFDPRRAWGSGGPRKDIGRFNLWTPKKAEGNEKVRVCLSSLALWTVTSSVSSKNLNGRSREPWVHFCGGGAILGSYPRRCSGFSRRSSSRERCVGCQVMPTPGCFKLVDKTSKDLNR